MELPLTRLPAQVAYRAANWDSPLWASPNPAAGRFNEARSGPTQYLCLHPLGPWAEQARAFERGLGRRLLEPDLGALEPWRRYWVVKLPALDVFDLGFESAAAVGLEPLDLVDDDQEACRRAADLHGRAEAAAARAWRYPSAALPGTFNLVFFGARRATAFDREPAGSRWPAVLAADLARMPVEVLDLMCHHGAPRRTHPSYRAWKAGAELRLRQPLRFRWPRA